MSILSLLGLLLVIFGVYELIIGAVLFGIILIVVGLFLAGAVGRGNYF
jgi:hypothetical protein